MSIYASLWRLKFPVHGVYRPACDWIEVRAQAVPGHIGTPTPGYNDEGDPYADFLPPPVELTREHDQRKRAVVIVSEHTRKGTARHPQEFEDPLLVLSADEYDALTFDALHERICDALLDRCPPEDRDALFPVHPALREALLEARAEAND